MHTHQKIENDGSRELGHVYLIGFNWLRRLQYSLFYLLLYTICVWL